MVCGIIVENDQQQINKPLKRRATVLEKAHKKEYKGKPEGDKWSSEENISWHDSSSGIGKWGSFHRPLYIIVKGQEFQYPILTQETDMDHYQIEQATLHLQELKLGQVGKQVVRNICQWISP